MSSKILLEPEKYYHIYNHAIGREMLFNSESDYKDFIKKFTIYISPISYAIAYCLMPNHFHMCLRIKEKATISFLSPEYFADKKMTEGIYRRFSHFFNSYVQAYNKRYIRMGGLFIGNFKRKEFSSDDSLRNLIRYIHNNPLMAGLAKTPEEWAFSSYFDIIAENRPESIPIFKDEHVRLFDDIENFKYVHRIPLEGISLNMLNF